MSFSLQVLLMTTLPGESIRLKLIEPASFFCDNSSCNVTRDGYMLYWDDDHVSASAAKAFAQQWLKTDDARHLLDGIVIEHK